MDSSVRAFKKKYGDYSDADDEKSIGSMGSATAASTVASALEDSSSASPSKPDTAGSKKKGGTADKKKKEKASAKGSAPAAAPAAEPVVTKKKHEFSLYTLREIAMLALFETLDDNSVQGLVLEQMWKFVDVISMERMAGESEYNDTDLATARELKLLRNLAELMKDSGTQSSPGASSDARAKNAENFGALYESLLRERLNKRSEGLLRRVAVALWTKVVYPLTAASVGGDFDFERVQEESLKPLINPLVQIVRVFDIANLEDPVLMGTVANLTASVLLHIQDFRTCISLLKKSLGVLESRRAERVDVQLHIPESEHDMTALVRAAVSTDRNEWDWLHSIKRVGANAVEGYGIFGAGSRTDPNDSALADIHGDMLALLYRTELQYSIYTKWRRRNHSVMLHPPPIAQGHGSPGTAGGTGASRGGLGTGSKTASAAGTGGSSVLRSQMMGSSGGSQVLGSAGKGTGISMEQIDIDADKLACIRQLRNSVAKNNYAKCILCMEMAKVDTNPDRRATLLQDAQSCVAEILVSEAVLNEALSHDTKSHDEPVVRPPQILARTHRSIYVSPAVYSKDPFASYYRVLAKEQGSGTDISVTSDYIEGTDVKIPANFVQTDKTGAATYVVKIDRLRPGERYVFGCAGFTREDKLIKGGSGNGKGNEISLTSLPIEAVNPLSTVYLNSLLSRVAEALGVAAIATSAAKDVISRYCTKVPRSKVQSLGKGFNAFVCDDTSFCMLHLQQATQVELECIINAHLTLVLALLRDIAEKRFDEKTKKQGILWKFRRDSQSSILTVIRKTASVAVIATFIKSQEYLVRTLCLGYSLIVELLLLGEDDSTTYLLPSLLTFIICLQQVPKHNWHDLENILYARLSVLAVKSSLKCRNTKPTVHVLTHFWPENQDKEKDALIANAAEGEFVSLMDTLQRGNALFTKRAPRCVDHLHRLYKMPVDLYWNMTDARRIALVDGHAQALLAPAADASENTKKLEKKLKELPTDTSALITVLVYMAHELIRQGKGKSILPLLAKYPVFDKCLSLPAREAAVSWGLHFINTNAPKYPESAMPAASSPTAGAGKGKKGGKSPKAAPAAAPEPESPEKVIEIDYSKYERVSEAEELMQLAALAELLALITSQHFPEYQVRMEYPMEPIGPFLLIDPMDKRCVEKVNNLHEFTPITSRAYRLVSGAQQSHDAEESKPGTAESSASAVSPSVSPRVESIKSPPDSTRLDKLTFIRFQAASVALFAQSKRPTAAIQASAKLWNFVVDEWIDPFAFASTYVETRPYIVNALTALLTELERLMEVGDGFNLTQVGSVKFAGLEDPEFAASRDFYTPKSNKELLFFGKDLMVYFMRVLWLLEEHKEVDFLGKRMIGLFTEKAEEYAHAIGEKLFGIIKNSGECLLRDANEHCDSCEKEMADFVARFEEAQRIKHRKKARIARLEKDEDELLFEAGRDKLQAKIFNAKQQIDTCERELERTAFMKSRLEHLNSPGGQLLSKVRISKKSFFDRCKAAMEDLGQTYPMPELEDHSKDVLGAFLQLMDQYTQLGHFLREKKDILVLMEALKEQGDLYLLFGKVHLARGVYNDIVDGFFNTLDACRNWKEVSTGMLRHIDPKLVFGVVPVCVALGKLSYFCATDDWDMKSLYCRMAATVSVVPFQESVLHPQTLIGFAAYECRQLGDRASMAFHSERIKAAELDLAMHEILTVLIKEEEGLVALPICVILEHYHAVYTQNILWWYNARIKRIRILVGLKLYAEAMSMLSTIPVSIKAIDARTYASVVDSSKHILSYDSYDTSKNVLDFDSKAPFFNNLPPYDEANKAALQWVESFPNDFHAFALKYHVKVPDHALSPEERAKREAQAKAEAAAAAAPSPSPSKKGKGKAAEAPKVETVSPRKASGVMKNLFDQYSHIELSLVCGELLMALGATDEQLHNRHSAELRETGSKGYACITKALEALASVAPKPKEAFGDPRFVRTYGRCIMNQIRYLTNKARFGEARAICIGFVHLLQGQELKTNPVDHNSSRMLILTIEEIGLFDEPPPTCYDARYIAGQQWNEVKYALMTVATSQGRYPEAVSMCSQSLVDASHFLSNFWVRKFLLQRASISFKLGRIVESAIDCDQIVQLCRTHNCENVELIRAMCLKATISREAARTMVGDDAVTVVREAINTLLRAKKLAEDLSGRIGFLGADANVSFESKETMEMRYDYMAPITYSLSDFHRNEPPLTLNSNLHPKMLNDTKPPNSTLIAKPPPSAAYVGYPVRDHTALQQVLDSTPERLRWNGRFGPEDSAEDVLTKSVYANVYLEEVKALCNVHTALVSFCDEVRKSNATVSKPIQQRYPGEKTSATALRDTVTKSKQLSFDELLCSQISAGEDGLKLLRHVLLVSPQMRLRLLMSVSRTRRYQYHNSENQAVPELPILRDCENSVPKLPERSTPKCYFGPLHIALEIGVSGTMHPWNVLREVCIELVECYADNTVRIPEDCDNRMKRACVYLTTAMKLGQQLQRIKDNVVGILDDKTFLSTAVSAPLEAIVRGFTKTSAESINGRDTLNLLVESLNEADTLWYNDRTYAIIADIHELLKQDVPSYAAEFSLSAPPDPTAEIVIQSKSISTLWQPTSIPQPPISSLTSAVDPKDKSPQSLFTGPVGTNNPLLALSGEFGLYSHIACYLLLGSKSGSNQSAALDAKKSQKPPAKGAADPAAPEPGNEPDLRKVVLFRPHVDFVECALRCILDRMRLAVRKNSDAEMQANATELGYIVGCVVLLLKNGCLNMTKEWKYDMLSSATDLLGDDDAAKIASMHTVSKSEEKNLFNIKFTLPKGSFTVPTSQTMVANLANVFTIRMDTYAVQDADISLMIREILEIGENVME
jgi:hypothetical protein